MNSKTLEQLFEEIKTGQEKLLKKLESLETDIFKLESQVGIFQKQLNGLSESVIAVQTITEELLFHNEQNSNDNFVEEEVSFIEFQLDINTNNNKKNELN